MVAGTLSALFSEKAIGELYNIGSTCEVTISDLAERCWRLVRDDEPKVEYLDYASFGGNYEDVMRRLPDPEHARGHLGFEPDANATLQFNADWEDRGDRTRYTLQGFAAWKNEDYRAGVLYARQTETETYHPDVSREVVSAFGVARVNERVNVFGRLDHNFDPAHAGISYLPFDPSAESSNLIVAGIDISPAKDIHIMPNVEAILYGDAADGTSPDTDVMPRVTVYYKFK